MRRALPHLTALACGAAAALAVGCGDRSHLIPQESASSLKDTLARVQAAVDRGDCQAASDAVDAARQQASALPSTVDRRLRIRLNSGIRQLKVLAAKDCLAAQTQTQQTQTQTVQTTTTTTETTPTTITTTPTTPTTTTPTTTETTPTTPTETQPSTTPNGGTPGEAAPTP